MLQGGEEGHQGQPQENESQHIPAVALGPVVKDTGSVSDVEPQENGTALHPARTQARSYPPVRYVLQYAACTVNAEDSTYGLTKLCACGNIVSDASPIGRLVPTLRCLVIAVLLAAHAKGRQA